VLEHQHTARLRVHERAQCFLDVVGYSLEDAPEVVFSVVAPILRLLAEDFANYPGVYEGGEAAGAALADVFVDVRG
jgi:hypothetical protein